MFSKPAWEVLKEKTNTAYQMKCPDRTGMFIPKSNAGETGSLNQKHENTKKSTLRNTKQKTHIMS